MQEDLNQIILPKDIEEQKNHSNLLDNMDITDVANIGETVAEVTSAEVVGTIFEAVCEIIGGVFGGLSN